METVDPALFSSLNGSVIVLDANAQQACLLVLFVVPVSSCVPCVLLGVGWWCFLLMWQLQFEPPAVVP